MKEFEKEITTKQIVYEITKEELDEIKRVERNNGRYDVIEYLSFTINKYALAFNLYGQLNWLREAINFLYGRTNSIDNIYGYSFKDFIRERRK